jgi:hypothetical protein
LGTYPDLELSARPSAENKTTLSDVERRAISKFVQHVIQMTDDMKVLDLGSDKFEAAGRAFFIATEQLGL